MENISKAIVAVMQEVKGIEKSMTVGEGKFSYKGVADQEVKKIIGNAMAKNGLSLLPIDVEATTKIERWEELDYNKNLKTKQSVFTEVKTKYLLLHTSGESIQISGYGHGVDAQDKGAGKATTYALKYALLYSFLVPTGDIDDADVMHSQEIATPKPKSVPKPDYGSSNVLKEAIDRCEDLENLTKFFTYVSANYELSASQKQLFTDKKLSLTPKN